MLPPEPLEQVVGHFEISDADSISTQRNTMWYYMLYRKDYKIGHTYRFYGIWWNNGEKTWVSHYDDTKLIETTYRTVEAGTFLCYHFHRITPWDGWNAVMLDEYAMVGSKATVYCEEPGPHFLITIELTEYRPGWG